MSSDVLLHIISGGKVSGADAIKALAEVALVVTNSEFAGARSAARLAAETRLGFRDARH